MIRFIIHNLCTKINFEWKSFKIPLKKTTLEKNTLHGHEYLNSLANNSNIM